MRGPRTAAAALPALLASLALPAAAAAQDAPVVAPGRTVHGALEDGDPADDASVYDLVRLDPGGAPRLVITLESGEFDVFLEVGVMEDGAFRPQVAEDDSPGLAAPGDARIFVDPAEEPWLGAELAVRVSSYQGGPDGAYALSVRSVTPAPQGDLLLLEVPGTTRGVLDETDALRDAHLEDRYRFRAEAGRRVLVGLVADFDAFLTVRRTGPDGPVVISEDDDGYGGTDAFVEIDVREAGEYELVVTSAFRGGLGPYALELWGARPLVRPIGGGG